MENSQSHNTNNLEHDNIKLLLEYKELLDSGIISQEEFDAKKKELLDAPSAAPENPSNATSNAASTETPAASPEIPATPRGMKWHNFLVKFGLRAQTIVFLIAGVIMVVAPFITDNTALHNVLYYAMDISIDSLIVTIIYIFYGLMMALAALLSSSARKDLFEYKAAGPNALQGSIAIGYIPIYTFMPMLLYSDYLYDYINDDYALLFLYMICSALLILTWTIVLFANKSYYKKRKHIFIN